MALEGAEATLLKVPLVTWPFDFVGTVLAYYRAWEEPGQDGEQGLIIEGTERDTPILAWEFRT